MTVPAATMLTLLDMLQRAVGYLEEKGIDSPRLDAEVLLADLLGCQRIDLYLQFERPVTPDEQSAYRERIRRRAAHEPVAYITGKKEFWSIELSVNADVLIPRPETETLVEQAVQRLRESGAKRIVDIGTGSGCVAIALATELPEARLIATDVSPAAVRVARANAEAAGVAERVAVREGSLLEAVPERPLDAVVSNPPYIPTAEVATLMPEVRDFEPALALDGGADGLTVVTALVRDAGAALAPGGWLLLETAFDGAEAVAAVLAESGAFEAIETVPDLAGQPRVVCGRRKAG